MKKIRFEFPDAPPKEQIKQIKSMMSVVKAFSKLVEEKVNLAPFKNKIKELDSRK